MVSLNALIFFLKRCIFQTPKLVALLLTWTCRAWKANDEQFDFDLVKIFASLCLSASPVCRCSYPMFNFVEPATVFELKVMSQCCWNWSQWAWVGLQSSCLHAVTRHSLQLKLKKFPRFLYLWSQVIRSAFNISNCSGLTTTLWAEIPLLVIFFRFFSRNTSPSC